MRSSPKKQLQIGVSNKFCFSKVYICLCLSRPRKRILWLSTLYMRSQLAVEEGNWYIHFSLRNKNSTHFLYTPRRRSKGRRGRAKNGKEDWLHHGGRLKLLSIFDCLMKATTKSSSGGHPPSSSRRKKRAAAANNARDLLAVVLFAKDRAQQGREVRHRLTKKHRTGSGTPPTCFVRAKNSYEVYGVPCSTYDVLYTGSLVAADRLLQ